MPPDFLLRCTACGAEAVWDTEAIPPLGVPEPGHPVLWRCDVCGGERRHVIEDCILIADKLHHEICIATELDRRTVDRVMAELHRLRQDQIARREAEASDTPCEAEAVAERLRLTAQAVADIVAARTSWLLRRGYPVDPAG